MRLIDREKLARQECAFDDRSVTRAEPFGRPFYGDNLDVLEHPSERVRGAEGCDLDQALQRYQLWLRRQTQPC